MTLWEYESGEPLTLQGRIYFLPERRVEGRRQVVNAEWRRGRVLYHGYLGDGRGGKNTRRTRARAHGLMMSTKRKKRMTSQENN